MFCHVLFLSVVSVQSVVRDGASATFLTTTWLCIVPIFHHKKGDGVSGGNHGIIGCALGQKPAIRIHSSSRSQLSSIGVMITSFGYCSNKIWSITSTVDANRLRCIRISTTSSGLKEKPFSTMAFLLTDIVARSPEHPSAPSRHPIITSNFIVLAQQLILRHTKASTSINMHILHLYVYANSLYM